MGQDVYVHTHTFMCICCVYVYMYISWDICSLRPVILNEYGSGRS